MNTPKTDNFELAWKTIRNNPQFELPETIDEQGQDDIWELRKQWFTYGWNNAGAFKDAGLKLVGKEKKLQLV